MKTDLVRTDVVRSTAAQKAGLVLAGVGILAASAWLSVPFYPVPLTMQTLAVLLVGGALGPALGVSAVAGYLALGALGAPIFHGGLGGVLVLAGPTGGYLAGFLPAVFVIGWAARGARIGSPVKRLSILAAGALAASAAIYVYGLPWLSLSAGLDLERTLAVGLVPFVLGDLLKAAVAVGAVYLGGRALSRRGSLLF
jgi:biotin transport system substrate-specific component